VGTSQYHHIRSQSVLFRTPLTMIEMRTLPLLLLLIGGDCLAQVQVDRPLILTGPTDTDRQVLSLPNSSEPAAVLTAGVEQAGAYRTVTATGTSLWNVTLPSLISDPIPGTHLLLLTPATASGPVSLLVNGAGPFPLINSVQSPYDATEVEAGSPLSVVFDGTSFHVLNGSIYARKPCDPGLVAVSEAFCIQPTEHGASDFFTANANCAANGLRLCSWTEFIVACNKATELGLTGMLGNWEWTDDAVNENGSARIAGSSTCSTTGTALVSGSIDRNSRCCHSR